MTKILGDLKVLGSLRRWNGSEYAAIELPADTTAPAFTTQPTISGTPTEGHTLTADEGVASGVPAPTLALQWLRDGSDISGATGLTYVLVTADIGASISVRSTATNSVGSVSATSEAVGPVEAASSQESPKLFVFAGQSNMYGQSTEAVPAELQPSDDGIKIWNGSAFVTLVNGTNGNVLGANTDWGPEAQVLYRYRQDHPTETIYAVKYAVNGTRLAAATGSDWNVASSGEYWDTLTSRVAAARAALGAVPVEAFFWMQGESDAAVATYADAYGANLAALIASVRSEIGNSETQFILGRIHNSLANGAFPYIAAVRKAQHDAADAPLTITINTDDYAIRSDNIHYLAAGLVSLGNDFYSAYAGAYIQPEKAETTAFFSAVSADGLASPATGWRTAYDDLIAAALRHGWWARCDVFRLYASYDEGVALRNLIQDSFHATKVASPDWTAKQGFLCSAGHLTSDYNPTTASDAKFLRDDAHYGVYSATDLQTGNGDICLWGGAAGSFFNVRVSTNNAQYRLNGSANLNNANSNGIGDFIANRVSSSASRTYRNGVTLGGENSAASIEVPSATEAIGSLTAASSTRTGREYAYSSIGGGMTAAQILARYQDIRAFLNAAALL